MFEIPLFPLSAHLLPGGRMALRIFEPRYLRMVKEACANNSGIGICMLNARGEKALNQHIYPIGTFARIVDFNQLEDGLLGITVAGESCFRIQSVHTQADELRVGQCESIDAWQRADSAEDIFPLDQRLLQVFEKYQELSQLYDVPEFANPLWVIYRWLELIPVDAAQKQRVLSQPTYQPALAMLNDIIQ